MQPYVFPYIGYMQLVHAADKFVFYDDVNFIKKGWINRNSIMLNDGSYRFTIPLKGQSQNSLIKDIEPLNLEVFKEKFMKQLDSSYKSSPFRYDVLNYVQESLNYELQSISDVAISSVKNFFTYVGIEKDFFISSKNFSSTKNLGAAERLMAITKELASENYINSIGGTSLYCKNNFAINGINLRFLKSSFLPYSHCNNSSIEFNSGLSIIDIMMNLPPDEILAHLDGYELV